MFRYKLDISTYKYSYDINLLKLALVKVSNATSKYWLSTDL